MSKAKAEPAKPQQVCSDDPGLVAWVAEMAAVGDRNRAALDKAQLEGATHYRCEQRRRGEDGQMHPYFEMVPVDPPEPEELTDEAVGAMSAEIDRVQEHNRRYIARLKPHELAHLETWLRTRGHNSPPPVRPTLSRSSNGCLPAREVRNGHGHGDRRGERPRSSSSDDPDPDPDPDSDQSSRRRLCAHCGKDIPDDRAPQARYCKDEHGALYRQRLKRRRDRERSKLPPTPSSAGDLKYRQLTYEELIRLQRLVVCRCNGDHQEFEPGHCHKCGRNLPRSARGELVPFVSFAARLDGVVLEGRVAA